MSYNTTARIYIIWSFVPEKFNKKQGNQTLIEIQATKM